MSKTLYTVAGYSRGPDGSVKFRVANDINRAGVLARNGHTEVSLRVLPIAMTRVAAEDFLRSAGAKKELGGLRACVDRAIKSEKKATAAEIEMTPAMARKLREEHNRKWRHLSHEDLVG